jgi:signal transduction histidine kinase/AmiR/NasT family two-component response regulator
MNPVIDPNFRVVQEILSAAFFVLGLLALRDYLRLRARTRAWLAVALICLGVVSGLSDVAGAGNISSPWIAYFTLLLLLMSGAALLFFRAAVVPYRRLTAYIYAVAFIAPAIAIPIVGIPTRPQCGSLQHLDPHTLATYAVVIEALMVWLVSLAEPAYTLWRASAGLDAVQRGRLRAMSVGYGTIVAVVLATVPTASACRTTAAQWIPEIASFVAIPFLYSSFAPPTFLKNLWRRTEEASLRTALQDLLLFSPNRKVLAHRALPWAVRLVGGESGVIVAEGSDVLATHGTGYEPALEILTGSQMPSQPLTVRLEKAGGRQAIVRPLHLSHGLGALIVIGGALSPIFEASEEDTLTGYSASIATALDRADLFDSMARQEREIRNARDIAQAANRAKSEFLSRMSHELRTPLTAMIGFAELIELDDITDRQREYAQTILRAGSHLLELINDILDIARIEEGKISMSPEAVFVGDLAGDVIELVKPSTAQLSITVTVDIDPELAVVADRQRLKQVLVNFMSNGVKYNRERGSVVLSAYKATENIVRIVASDTGVGMSADDVDLLFSPFNRLWAQRSGIEGTGLGLALSKTLAEAMQGSIGVSSELGKGSKFWIELPVADPELLETARAVQEAEATAVVVSGPARLVLLAEDTESNIKLVKGILRHRPSVRLLTAPDGQTAIVTAKKHSPDLILLDLHLPDIDGAEVLKRMREIPSLEKTPVVIVTADATDEQRDRLLAAGAQEYITKPLRLKRLLQVVDAYLLPEKAEPTPSPETASST